MGDHAAARPIPARRGPVRASSARVADVQSRAHIVYTISLAHLGQIVYTHCMEHEFDISKDMVNIAKHGVSLGFGASIFADPDNLLLSASRVEDGEQRYKIIGEVNGRLWTAIFTMRGEKTRFISVRKSNDKEVRTYHRSPG